ncbi:hypothetical protein, partial [Sinorhizobium meliloti]|uniref:hypothetical protein n=1 Tax=Rhizobium meliloti TaxID=382 RepID=UPI001AEC092C
FNFAATPQNQIISIMELEPTLAQSHRSVKRTPKFPKRTDNIRNENPDPSIFDEDIRGNEDIDLEEIVRRSLERRQR